MTCARTKVDESRRNRPIERHVMRLLALVLTLLLADFAVASAQTAAPDTENGRNGFDEQMFGAVEQVGGAG